MNEENQTNTTINDSPKKKGKKAKVIIIVVLAVILVAAIVIGILLATGVLDFNISNKSKMVAGVEKLGESITKPLEEITNNKDGKVKILNNLSKESGIDLSGEISADIDTLDIKTLSSSDKENLKSIIELINNSRIGIDTRYDGNEKAYMNLDLGLDDINLSGEVVYDGEQASVRSEEINSKWLTISKEDLEKMLEEENVDIEDIKENMSTIIDQFTELTKSVEIDEKDQKEIKERYGKVLKNFINEKSKSIESEKDKVKVDGKNKNCQKLTLELKEDDIKELLKEYIKTFKNDSQIQDILRKSLDTYANIVNDSSIMDEDAFDEMISELDNLEKEIEELEFEGKITLTVYATNTEVYKTDITIEIEGTEVTIGTTFNETETVMAVSAKSSGVSLDIATITIKSDENNYNVKIETSSSIEEYLRQKMSVEINYKNEKNKNEIVINLNAGNYGEGNITITEDMNINEDKECESTTTVDVDIDIPMIIEAKGKLDLKSNIKTENITIPTISSSEAIDMNDESKLAEYLKEAQENITKLFEKVSENEALKPLVESFVKQYASTFLETNTNELDSNI